LGSWSSIARRSNNSGLFGEHLAFIARLSVLSTHGCSQRSSPTRIQTRTPELVRTSQTPRNMYLVPADTCANLVVGKARYRMIRYLVPFASQLAISFLPQANFFCQTIPHVLLFASCKDYLSQQRVPRLVTQDCGIPGLPDIGRYRLKFANFSVVIRYDFVGLRPISLVVSSTV
jgi:hypothetical protein